MKWILGYVTALCAMVWMVCSSIAFPTFFMPFYRYEFNKSQVPETIQVDSEELLTVTTQLLDYMRGRCDDLVVYAHVNGTYREFFNQKEKDHMVDVRNLFDTGFKVRNIAFWSFLMLIFLMLLLKIRVVFVLARCLREVLTGFLLMALLLFIIIALDFNRAFDMFHLLFFTNDLWQLDANTDLLVNIVPLEFFMDIAASIAVIMGGLSLAVIIAATVYLRRVSRLGRGLEHF